MAQVTPPSPAASSAWPARTARKSICSRSPRTRRAHRRAAPAFGEIGDTRLTVMAALMVADEMSEAERKIRRLEEEIAPCRTPAWSPPTAPTGLSRGGRRLQFGRRADRGHHPQAQPDRRRERRHRVRRRFTSPTEVGFTASSASSIGRNRLYPTSRGEMGAWRFARTPTTLPRRGCGVRRRQIPRGLTIPTGAVPGRARGLGIWRPPTYVGSRDHAPTAVAAPHLSPISSRRSSSDHRLCVAARNDWCRPVGP